mmetsp:Transcript_19893/g.39676  ORF Transcript_19893/g.39676 Transcript_19893/m.39676 type:complete len:139 (+) Transcript_19893:95-511(+)
MSLSNPSGASEAQNDVSQSDRDESVHTDADAKRWAPYLQAARRVHAAYPLFDGHNDLPWAVRCGFDMRLSDVDLTADNSSLLVPGIPWGKIHTDLPRLRAGGVGANFWSVYIPTSLEGPAAIQATLEQIDIVHRMCDR